MVDIRSTGVSFPIAQLPPEVRPEEPDEIVLEEILLLARSGRAPEETEAQEELAPEQMEALERAAIHEDQGSSQGEAEQGEPEATAFAIIDGEPVLVSGRGQARKTRIDPGVLAEAYRSGAFELVVDDRMVLLVPTGRAAQSPMFEALERARARRLEAPLFGALEPVVATQAATRDRVVKSLRALADQVEHQQPGEALPDALLELLG